MDSVVQRLHRALAEAVASRRGDVESQPVTVAEIYQELVPYRAVRTSVGFEMNADYEHALLRLLSGEEALVRLEPEEARSHLARELGTPNPDVTLFRRYAACDVWVTTPVGELPDIGGLSLQSEEAWRTPGWLDDAALRVDGRARAVVAMDGPERLRGEWWASGFDRDYYRVRLDGLGDCWVFRDGGDGRLYLHGFFD